MIYIYNLTLPIKYSCAGGGQLYMWGKLKVTGDDWMYPKPLLDLRFCSLQHFSPILYYCRYNMSCMCDKFHIFGGTIIYPSFLVITICNNINEDGF